MAKITGRADTTHSIINDPLHHLVSSHLKVGLVILDSENLIFWANETILEWFDSTQPLIGQPAAAFFADQEISIIDVLTAKGSSGEAVSTQLNTLNGPKRFWISSLDLQIESRGFKVLVAHETADQTPFEATARQDQAALNEILNNLPVAILTFDEGHKCVSCNHFGQTLYNLSSPEFYGQSIGQIFPEKRFPMINTALEKFSAAGEHKPFSEKFTDPDAFQKWHQVTFIPTDEGLVVIGVDITERKFAEQDILQKEDWLRSIFDSSLSNMIVVDANGRINMANDQFCLLLGYKQAELVGKIAVSLVVPEEKERAAKAFFTFLNGEYKPVNEEVTLSTKTGKKVLLKINAKTIHNIVLDQPEVILSFEDITEQRRNEKINSVILSIAKAAGSTSLDKLYATIHETIKEIMPANNFYISSYDAEKNIVSFPYFVDEHDPLPEPVDADQIGKSITMYVLRSGKPLLCSQEVSDELYKKGEVDLYGAFPAIWLGVPLVVEGKTIGVMALQHYTDPNAYSNVEKRVLEFVSTEVAKAIQKKQAENALIESERRFRSVVQFTPIGVHLFRLLANDDLVLITSNAAADKILNTKLDLHIGERLEQLYPQLIGEELANSLRSIARDGGVHRAETVSNSENGEIKQVLEMDAFQPSPNEVAVHFQDITARVVYEQEIKSLNEDLEQRVYQRTLELEASNREMEAFAYSVSHDLRAPVRAVKGFAEIMLAEEDDPEKIELITRIAESGTRMDQLINGLLSLSRLGSQVLNIKKINLSAVAESIFLEETNTNDREIDFLVEPTPPAMADQEMMQILLTNLINNSIKFTTTRQTPKISFGVKEINGRKAYYVADNGVGFDMKYAEKVFSPFERLHATDYEGTGIGLAIVYRVIRRHEGQIWVETAPDRGATFYFSFDQSRPEPN